MKLPRRPAAKAASLLEPARRAVLPAALLCATLSAFAAPPPGHPSPADAMRMMQPPTTQDQPVATHVGEVVSAVDANQYTYIEVNEAGRTHWIAGPRMKLERGDRVRFDDGVMMTNFYSKLLQRTFPAVMFVGNVSLQP
jgi:hypothetical protein